MISKLSVTVYLFLALYGSTTIQTWLFLKNIKNFLWFPKKHLLGFFILEKQLANILDRDFLFLRNTLLLYSLSPYWWTERLTESQIIPGWAGHPDGFLQVNPGWAGHPDGFLQVNKSQITICRVKIRTPIITKLEKITTGEKKVQSSGRWLEHKTQNATHTDTTTNKMSRATLPSSSFAPSQFDSLSVILSISKG